MKKALIILAVILMGIVLIALEISLIGSMYQEVLDFWKNATAYVHPKWNSMAGNCLLLLFLIIFSVAVPAAFWSVRRDVKKIIQKFKE